MLVRDWPVVGGFGGALALAMVLGCGDGGTASSAGGGGAISTTGATGGSSSVGGAGAGGSGGMGGGASGPLRAFPGAEGYGRDATGGRGGPVIYVTNLNDAGPGSFRAAAEMAGPRNILFQVSGDIVLESPLNIMNGDVTIAGQTSPHGVTFRKYPVYVRSSNVVLRYLRFRLGREAGEDKTGLDAFGVIATDQDISDVIVDHSSFSWCRDENLDVIGTPNPPSQPQLFGVSRVTLSWNIVSEGLENHAFGGFIKYQVSDVSVLYNLFSNNTQRSPNIHGANGHLINNVIYNWRGRAMTLGEGVQMNIIGNHLASGPSTNQPNGGAMIVPPQTEVAVANGIYVADNYHSDYRTNVDDGDEWAIFAPNQLPSQSIANEGQHRALVPHDFMEVTSYGVFDGRDRVLADAGASHARDAVDARLVAEADSGGTQGQIITDPSEVGGWPAIAMGTPYPDGDGDGMADGWETDQGLDPADPSDGPLDADGDGYTNLEEFLAALLP